MTRIFILPNDQVQIQLESPLPAASLATAVNAGRIPDLIKAHFPGEIPALRAICAGSQVIVLPVRLLTEDAPPSMPPLSPRQRAVLQALAQGLTNRQIAHRLGLSHRSVEYHLAVLRQRLGGGSRPQLVARAASAGLINPRVN